MPLPSKYIPLIFVSCRGILRLGAVWLAMLRLRYLRIRLEEELLSRISLLEADSVPASPKKPRIPARIVPKAISMALTFTYVVGWLFNIVLVFCMVNFAPRDILRPQR